MEDIVAQDNNIRRLHNMRPIGHIFCSDKRGRLLWKYRDDVFVSYSSRHHTDSEYDTLNMLKGEQVDELQSGPHSDGRPELLSLANDLSVPAEIRALAVHGYGSYDGMVVIELAHLWNGGRRKKCQMKITISGDQNHPGRIFQVDRKTYFIALYLGVMKRKGLEFRDGIQSKVRNLADQRFYGKMASKDMNDFGAVSCSWPRLCFLLASIDACVLNAGKSGYNNIPGYTLRLYCPSHRKDCSSGCKYSAGLLLLFGKGLKHIYWRAFLQT